MERTLAVRSCTAASLPLQVLVQARGLAHVTLICATGRLMRQIRIATARTEPRQGLLIVLRHRSVAVVLMILVLDVLGLIRFVCRNEVSF